MTTQSYEETKFVKCEGCGKGSHVEKALFCNRCGSKLDLSKVESKEEIIHGN